MDKPEIRKELFQIATAPPLEGLRRWEELVRIHPPQHFDFRLRRLLPAVWKNLSQLETSLPYAELLKSRYESAVKSNLELEEACRDVVRYLEIHGIEVLVLKGIVWSRTVHQDLGVRPACDFDILVPFEQVTAAQALLVNDGWQPLYKKKNPRERLSHGSPYRRSGQKLDLHWFLLSESRLPHFDEPLWREKETFDLAGYQAWTLSLRHQLFLLLAITNREFFHRDRYLYDLKAFLSQFPDEAARELDSVHRMLRERHLLHRLSGLPLELLGFSHLKPKRGPGLLDRVWSQAGQQQGGYKDEIFSGLYPFLDYWMNYRGQKVPGWSLSTYLRRRLRVDDPMKTIRRSVMKIARILGVKSNSS